MSRPTARIDSNKRRPPSDTAAVEPLPKKQKLTHPIRPPPAFWDNLSEIPLTRSALRELDRRSATASSPPTTLRPRPSRRPHRPVPTSLQPATQYLRRSGQSELNHLRAFARQGGIYPDGYEYPNGEAPPPPDNLNEILRALAKPRPSLSPSRFSDGDFRQFKRADTHAAKEWQVTSTVIPIIEGDVEDTKCVSGQIPFTNLDHLTDGSLVPGNPDRYHGSRPEQLDRQIRTELSGHVVPSTQHDLPIAPNFFLAVKGPDGSSAVAARQASYDGALGARGMRSLRSYCDSKPDFDNSAYVITSTYHDGQLKMYTSHPLLPASPGARCEFATTQINSWSMTGNASTFRQGATAYRNSRDWAKQERDKAIQKANERSARDEPRPSAPPDDPALSFASSERTLMQFRLDSNTASSFGGSDTSADELGLEVPTAKRTRRGRQPVNTNPES
ncbi:hypothetical protein F5Y16DRAFT_406466 [Xylariaceae sp. FL0255]|nr:hypothetical protein F5Y16DRAFT_406466 [Xylariaceae sp. FL0255]